MPDTILKRYVLTTVFVVSSTASKGSNVHLSREAAMGNGKQAHQKRTKGFVCSRTHTSDASCKHTTRGRLRQRLRKVLMMSEVVWRWTTSAHACLDKKIVLDKSVRSFWTQISGLLSCDTRYYYRHDWQQLDPGNPPAGPAHSFKRLGALSIYIVGVIICANPLHIRPLPTKH